MAKVSPLQSNFSTGEVSPLLYGRVDNERYKAALATCQNYIPTVQGALVRRPGTEFIAEARYHDKKCRLERFEFSSTQAYILEFGHEYVRAYTDYEQVLFPVKSPFPPQEQIDTPYTEDEVFELKFAQSADVLYIVHPNHAPMTLTRGAIRWGVETWSLDVIDVKDGPYMAVNSTATTITVSAYTPPPGLTADVKLTASTADFFQAPFGDPEPHVGLYMRIKNGGTWVTYKLAFPISGTEAAAYRVNTSDPTSIAATKTWRMGLWGQVNGFPSAIVFHEDRLVFGGVPNFPQRIDGSNSGDYLNFSPSAADGTLTAANAYTFTLNSSDVNEIKWLSSDEKGLIAGTNSGEWVVRPSSFSEALSATNVSAKRVTSYGSYNTQAVQAGKATIFVQRAARKLREIVYYYDVDGHRATDLTVLSEHITESGVVQMAHTKEPQSLVWCVLENGELAAMTYERDLDALRVGWHRHILGGVSNAEGSAAVVESVASIPSPDGLRDELYMVVRRRINGTTKRYIEYMTPFFDDTVSQSDAWHVDCGLKYEGPAATTISGLNHLEGQTVEVWANGVYGGSKTVTSGAITLSSATTKAIIGLKMTSKAKMLPIEAGAADGTALGKTRRINRIGIMLHRTAGIKLGPSFTALDAVALEGTGLFSGIASENVDFDYDFYNEVCWQQDTPAPGMVLAVMPQMHTQDR